MKGKLKWFGSLMLLAAMCLGVVGLKPVVASAENVDGYVALDANDPIEFGGTYIVYKGETITLSETAIYLDGSLSDDVVAQYPNVYNDIKDALSADVLKEGTADAPMTVYIAPYVYWIDDPLATDTVGPTPGYGSPYGMVVSASKYLDLVGLNTNPENVVIAGNRGQYHGANGNYTMFRFNVTNLNVSNIRFGNYCAIDLEYPLKPELNQPKRTTTISQAQIADMSGQKMFADNCDFVSRLNLDPINGASRSLYNECHFECTDDALNGRAVYLNCDFDFYGNRPFYSTSGSGAAFLNCVFNCLTLNVEGEPNQFFTKEGGPVIAVDSEYISNFEGISYGIGWTKYPSASLKCYQYNILHNGAAAIIGGEGAAETVDMTGKDVLKAYRLEKDGVVYYNTYNLLKGSDDWDPMGVKEIFADAAAVPTLLSVRSNASSIETGVSTATITASASYFYGGNAPYSVTYKISEADDVYADIVDNGDGTCTVTGANYEDIAHAVVITAVDASGLEAAVQINVTPGKIDPPAFIEKPVITVADGKANVSYNIELNGKKDVSIINWYRCSDAEGANPILVAVTRNDEPLNGYVLSAGDAGYYLMASVAPKTLVSDAGAAEAAVYTTAITADDVTAINYSTDFANFPGSKQAQVLPGFWTVDTYMPSDASWTGFNDAANPYVYGVTGNGCVGAGLYQGTRGSRIMYTPVAGEYGDMSLTFVVDPAKTAGQGFGSANQYMDVCLKFDTTTLTGYGLRIIRTKAASNACTFYLVKYDNGTITAISEEVIASCYVTGCTIELAVKDGKLTANVTTPTAQLADQAAAGYPHEISLSADVEANTFGGVHIQHTGTQGSGNWQNTTMLHNLDIVWAGKTAQNPSIPDYTPLDAADPVEFYGSYIVYKGEKIELSETAIFLDGSLSDEVADKYDFVYNDIKEVLTADVLNDGTEDAPMKVYIAPYVYWIHDPLSTETVTSAWGAPTGMTVSAKYLDLIGLNEDPEDVVIAANRGQSHGSQGNYTMFQFNVTNLNVENLTIGNYCSIDLEYPLKPELNQPRRTTTITQAQLASMRGDKLYAENCDFLSRLNLMPINGASRSLYNECHFESTDDALNGNAVYLHCDFEFYGNRPFYSTSGSGAAFLGCTFNSVLMNVESEPNQYFTKEGGQVIAVDSEYISNYSIPFGVGWTKYPSASLKCYQYNVLHNGSAVVIGGEGAAETVEMAGKDVLAAYRLEKDGQVYYNTYNLLKGADDWDPMGVKDIVVAEGKDAIATRLTVRTDASEIESGVSTATLTASASYFYGTAAPCNVTYSIRTEDVAYAQITDNGDGTCTVVGTNNEELAHKVVITAVDASGLEGAVAINVKPAKVAPPSFVTEPTVTIADGKAIVNYVLDLNGRKDVSVINWYRCADAAGTNPILVAVTRNDEPLKEYTLTAGDTGYYLMATVAPKSLTSDAGEAKSDVADAAVVTADVKSVNMSTDFANFPGSKQDQILPGFWTVDTFMPSDTSWTGFSDAAAPYVYGVTGNGCVGAGLYQTTRGARLMYTPVTDEYGNMSLKLVVDPAKTAGQGFGSAGQYMDVCLKFDTTTLTGYGLRIMRTRAASNAVTFSLVKYDNGTITTISEEVIASCYVTGCTVELEYKDGKLNAKVTTPTAQLGDQAAAGYPHEVNLSADVEANNFGGIHIQHTGTTGSGGWQNTTMLHNLDVVWEGDNAENPAPPAPPVPPVQDDDDDDDDDDDAAVTPAAPSAGTTTATGDTTPIGLYLGLLFVAVAALAGILISKRRSVE